MQENFDNLSFEYVPVRKVKPWLKVIAFILVSIFLYVPMFEFLVQFKPTLTECTYGIVSTCGCIIP